MREGRPSATAQRVALRRAAHQLIDRPLVLDDPLATRVLGAAAGETLRRDPHTVEATPLDRYLRAFMVARSRFAEDAVAERVGGGVDQYVLLGAGLDTFAYRSPHASLRVFEVDHPETQAWKRERLSEGRIDPPDSLSFVPVDFEHDSLPEALVAAGFRRGAPAIFAMLGVVPYLTLDALDRTWRFVASGAPGSAIVFDYSIPPEAMTGVARAVFDAMASRVAAAGEPWRTTFEPAQLAGLLRGCGFSTIEDLGAPEINGRYFAGRSDGLRVGGAGRLVRATT